MTLNSVVSPQVLNKYLMTWKLGDLSIKVGEEAKKTKSPAKSGRVGISAL